MANRNCVGPPPPGHGTGRRLQSPRRQAAVHLPTGVPANTSLSGSRRSDDSAGVMYPRAIMLANAGASRDITPKIAEIQSRVEELVRRYDDAVTAADREEFFDEDDNGGGKRVRTPARWRVGDVLLATHRALARTSTHTERSIVADFADDPEVTAAIGSGDQKMGVVFTEASEQAARRHQRLLHIHQALQTVAVNGMSLDDSEDEEQEKLPSPVIREHQLRSTIDALHREKDSMAAQLQEALRAQQESRMAVEQQAQELSKAQRALRIQMEELRLVQEHNEKATEAANTLTASWRDKFQASAKAATTAEARVQELEAKVRTQSEEIMKHTFVLQAKMQETEHFKESEAARSRAEAAAHAAALAAAEAETRRVIAKAQEAKRKSKLGADICSKDLKEMDDKIRELEGTILAVEAAKEQLESENAELTQRHQDLQARFGEMRRARFSTKEEPETSSSPVSTFSLRLRENAPRVNPHKVETTGAASKLSTRPLSHMVLVTPIAKDEDGDLSSSESEAGDSDNDEVDDVVKDERELNYVMKQVVASVFPVMSPEEIDPTLDESIAQYEDPARSPLKGIQPTPINPVVVVSDGDMVSRSELETLRMMYEHEVDALKQQYVDGLQEYKRLVIEQYGRRQAIERERHRLEIEGLLRLTQNKFHAELSRRSDRLNRAKEALKVLYTALRLHTGPDGEPEHSGEDLAQPSNSATPLKTILHAAILAMSSSAKRNGRGRMQIEAIHERLTKSPDIRTRAVAAAMTIHTAIQDDKSHKKVDSWCQTEPVTTPRDRRLLDAAPVEQRVAPESLDGYVLPGSPCFRKLKPAEQPHELVMKFHLVVGSPVSETLVAELRRLMPNLPPDIFYVSSALRLALFHELVRFYAAVEMQATANNTRVSPQAKRVFEGEGQIQDAEVVIGSPRDTPFLRRKALETIKSKTRQRNSRHLFTSGGVAILQTAFTSTSQHSPR